MNSWRTVVVLAVVLAVSARAAEGPKGTAAQDGPAAEARARADHAAAVKAATDAEASIAPLEAAMRKADTDFANASKTANAKRRLATDNTALAGAPGAQELKQAEANVPAAAKALTDASNARPALEKALAEAKAAAQPLQAAFDAAEKLAREAEAAAKTAAEVATRVVEDAKKATAQATTLRRAADTAKSTLDRAQQNERKATTQVEEAPRKVADAETQKKAADAALASASAQLAAATTAAQTTEKEAVDAEAKAKAAPEPARAQAAADAGSRRKAADTAKGAQVQARAAHQNAQKLATSAEQKVARAVAQAKLAETALANVKKRIAAATAASQAAEQAAQAAAKVAAEKDQAAAQVAAKRKAAVDATGALAQANQAEQQAQAQVSAAAGKLAEAQAQKKTADLALTSATTQAASATAASETAEKAAQAAEAAAKQAADEAAAKRKAADAAKAALAPAQQAQQTAQAQAAAATQRLAEATSQQTAPADALAKARALVASATAANQAARDAAKDVLQLDTTSQQTAADADAKRKAAETARAALAPVQQKLEQAAVQANNNTQEIARAEARKKATEEGLANLKQRIASAVKTHAADDQAARDAEAAAVPLKAEAAKTRSAYTAAVEAADAKRAQAEQAKFALYRLVAARQVTGLMESPGPPKPVNRIDEIVFAKLKALGIQPAVCSDPVFVRRVHLDTTGKLPTADEARAFLQDADPNKRAALVGRLLDRSEHVDYWAMRWSDLLRVKAEFPVKLWPNAAQAYHRWIWESVERNKPYDQFARELLTSSGSNFRVGPVNFYRAIQNRTPEGIAGAVALSLMGTRVHLWPEDRRAGMSAFFSQVGYKPTSEWKEEVVFWDPLKSAALPGSTAPGVDAVAKAVSATNQVAQSLAQPLAENGPLAVVFPDGTKATVPPGRDPREAFADWLIRPENPWFVKNVVNRTWAWAMGRGIVNEPDDVREGNPPSNPELLAFLEKEFVDHHHDLKYLKNLIFTSTTYQFSSVPRHAGPEARANFASYPLRRVEAEVLIDAVNDVTGSTDLYTSAVPEPFTYIPNDVTAVALADGSITSSFLTMFGRSARATGMATERVSELESTQWLHMLNSATIQAKLQNGPKLAALIASGGTPKELAEKLYLTFLSRLPTEADVQAVEEYAKASAALGPGVWVDLAWALVNSPEFLLRH